MKPEKIDQLYFSDVNEPIKLDRREFLKKLGGGIIVVFCLGKLSMLDGFSQTSTDGVPEFNAYLRVKEDGTVNCYTGKIEMGQGIITSLAMVLAEELEVSINAVNMVMGDTDLCPYDAGTWGSLTTRFADPVIRSAAAEAREILVDLAAKKLNVLEENLVVENGIVFEKGNKKNQVSYAELTKGKKIIQGLENKPPIKKSKDFKIIGKPVISTDAIAKVTGKAAYSGDIKIPGMVYAVAVRPTIYGSKKLSVNSNGLAPFNDVQLVEDGNFIAVTHTDLEIAKKAAKKVKVTWDAPKIDVNNTSIFKYLEENIKGYKTNEESGNLETGKTTSDFIVSAEYYDGYKAHAPIETHSTTCYFEKGKLIVYTSTQTPFGTRDQLANKLKMSTNDVLIKQIFIGGGFGGKIYNQQAIEAAIIAKKINKPVQLVWSRREEFLYDKFRTAALMKIESGIDKEGNLTLWNFDIYCAGTRGTKLFYKIPNNRTRLFKENFKTSDHGENKSKSKQVHLFGTGAWRAPGNNTTTFARESHIDATAHAAGIDALEFRLQNLNHENMKATLQLAAKTFNWNKPKKEGYGYGIALGEDAGTCVAIIAEVHVDKSSGEVTPIRVVCAQDMGQVVNPHGAIVQTEGGITMGLGYALYEEIKFEGGKLSTRNFNKYEITRFSKTPEIKCVFIDKMDAKPQGGGEPAIICVGGAIANAVFDACGARVNELPITPNRILEALKS